MATVLPVLTLTACAYCQYILSLTMNSNSYFLTPTVLSNGSNRILWHLRNETSYTMWINFILLKKERYSNTIIVVVVVVVLEVAVVIVLKVVVIVIVAVLLLVVVSVVVLVVVVAVVT
jgi:hypothetical protein